MIGYRRRSPSRRLSSSQLIPKPTHFSGTKFFTSNPITQDLLPKMNKSQLILSLLENKNSRLASVEHLSTTLIWDVVILRSTSSTSRSRKSKLRYVERKRLSTSTYHRRKLRQIGKRWMSSCLGGWRGLAWSQIQTASDSRRSRGRLEPRRRKRKRVGGNSRMN